MIGHNKNAMLVRDVAHRKAAEKLWREPIEAEEEHCEKQIKRILVGGAILFVIVLLSCIAVFAVPPIRVQPAPGQRRAVLTASDAGADDRFGISCTLSSDGSVMAVGAYNWDGAEGDQGCVYIYDRSGSAWVQRGAVLTASDAGADDRFGISCTLSSDGAVLAVGAYFWDGAGGGNQGGVYIYDRSGSAWVQRGAVLTASDAGASDYYGVSCTLSSDGDVMAVGADYWDGAGGGNQGGMYIYDIVNPMPVTINGKPIGTP